MTYMFSSAVYMYCEYAMINTHTGASMWALTIELSHTQTLHTMYTHTHTTEKESGREKWFRTTS